MTFFLVSPFGDLIGDSLGGGMCQIVQMLHNRKIDHPQEPLFYAGLCSICTKMHNLMVPRTGIEPVRPL